MLNTVFVFFLFYALQFGSYFFSGYYLSYWEGFQEPDIFNKVSILNMLFISGVGLLNLNNRRNVTKFTEVIEKNYPAFYICILVGILFSIFGINTSSVSFEVNKNPMYEYTVIFIFLAYVFSGNKKVMLITVNFFVAYYSIKGFIFGGRIESIQSILILFYFNFNFAKDLSKKKYYLGVVFFSFILYVIGRVRHNWNLIYEVILEPSIIFAAQKNAGVVSNNFGDVIVSSARMIGLVDSGYWDFLFRIESFLSYFFNVFLFGSEFKGYANLAGKDQSIYGAGGGGLISSYFYVWGSFLLVVVASFIIGKLISNFFTSNNKCMQIYGFLTLVTFPRWYAYSPINLVKLIIIAIIIYYIFRILLKSSQVKLE